MTKPRLLALLAAVALAGCGRSGESGKPAAPAPASAPAAAPASTPSTPATAWVSPVSKAEQDKAVDLTVAAIRKYKLTSLSPECLIYVVDEQDATHYSVEVMENHTPACGGDPATAPRVVTLLIDKKTGALQKDDPTTGEYVPLK